MNGSRLVSAERTLFWAGLALAVAGLLMERARGDVTKAKDELRAARNARVDLEAKVDELTRQMDGALETIHRLQSEPPAGAEA